MEDQRTGLGKKGVCLQQVGVTAEKWLHGPHAWTSHVLAALITMRGLLERCGARNLPVRYKL